MKYCKTHLSDRKKIELKTYLLIIINNSKTYMGNNKWKKKNFKYTLVTGIWYGTQNLTTKRITRRGSEYITRTMDTNPLTKKNTRFVTSTRFFGTFFFCVSLTLSMFINFGANLTSIISSMLIVQFDNYFTNLSSKVFWIYV